MSAIRNHEEFLSDIQGRDWLSNEVLWKWFREEHSVSKHMLTLYSIVRGLDAKRVLEIGFGRSSLVLARATHENAGEFVCCDRGDFGDFFSDCEKRHTRCVNGSDAVWMDKEQIRKGFDFAFLDYFSAEHVSLFFCIRELRNCLRLMKTGGIICIHDVADPRYPVHRIWRYLRHDDALESVILPYNQGLAIIHKRKQRHGWISALRLSLLWCCYAVESLLYMFRRFLKRHYAAAP
jgi:predicted O-methyltransferase YrrM